MSSVQRFIANNRNAVAGATLTASAVKAARAVRQVSTTRSGNGRVLLAGDYIGHADTQIDIEVLDGGTTQRASAPAFTGVGSGALSVVAVDTGATPQTLTYTLADLGTETTHAELAVTGVSIRAKDEGAAGNSINITVTPDITLTATEWSLLADWPASQTTQTGEQWHFGGLPLSSKGELDALTPRIRFGADADVYRPYREYKDGAWRMGLSPALKNDIKAGTPVQLVTGGYDITITDGVTPETYEDVESFHDLLVALAASDLVEVVGVSAADRRPGGIAVVDVPLRTQSWLMAQSGTVKLADVAAGAAAPTEIVTVSCINADAVGAEVWGVSGTVSGDIGQAITGIPFSASPLSFLVPPPDVTKFGTGNYTQKIELMTRDTPDSTPSICVRNFRLGVNATPRTVTFIYQERPDDACDCNDAELTGKITDACLGLDGGYENMALDIEYQTRLSDLYEWRADFYDGGAPDYDDVTNGERDRDLVDACTRLFADTLALIYSSSAARTIWDASFADMQADMVAYDGVTEYTGDVDIFVRRYQGRMDLALVAAGIVPKSNASSAAGDGCWRDDTSATHWWVDPDGFYLPAFTNTAYVSASTSTGSGQSEDVPVGDPFSTKEFGFYIAVSCEERLLAGDKVIIDITGVDGNRPFSVGDSAEIHLVAGGPAYLAGGVDGDDTLTWSVSGSVDGPLTSYALDESEPTYHHGGAEVQINRGGIPFALGDAFTLGIESGQYRWRRDAGAWSTAADIDDGPLPLADGLTAEFVPGAAPSFLDGDAWTFTARQPYAPANLQTPGIAAWAWSGTGANMVINLGAETDITVLALARYRLPTGATVLIEGGNGTLWPESQSMDVSGAVSVAVLADMWSVTHLRLTVASATGGSIGWLWAGEPLSTTYSAARCRMARAYAIQRGGAINPSAQYLGSGQSGEIAWDADSSPLLQSDLDAVLEMLDHMQRNGEPMILVPHYLHADESGLVRVDSDSIDPQEYFELQPNDASRRIISLALTLQAVHQ